MQALVKLTNIYIGSKKSSEQTPNHAVLESVAKYLTRMLKIFGAEQGEQLIGFSTGGASTGSKVLIGQKLWTFLVSNGSDCPKFKAF